MEGFTYLEPEKWRGSTWEDRRPEAKAYWDVMDPDHVCGPGAESFAQLMCRVVMVLARLSESQLSEIPPSWILAFTHGQFMQAVKVLVDHPQESLKALMGRLFHERLFNNIECYTLELHEVDGLSCPRHPARVPCIVDTPTRCRTSAPVRATATARHTPADCVSPTVGQRRTRAYPSHDARPSRPVLFPRGHGPSGRGALNPLSSRIGHGSQQGSQPQQRSPG